jgi:hypothetical protein
MSSVGLQLRERRYYGFRSQAEGPFAKETAISTENVLMACHKNNSGSLRRIGDVCGSIAGVCDLGMTIHEWDTHDLGQTSVTLQH